MPESLDNSLANDGRLVQRLLAGDEAAFHEFFKDASTGLLRFAMIRLDNQSAAAEEVVQLTLTRALRKLHTYRGEAALFTWLCAICRREIGAHWRRQRRIAREIGLAHGDLALRTALDERAVEEGVAAAQRREVSEHVRQALESLPERYSDALDWKYIEGLPVEEVGRRLGLGVKAAESLLVRARQAFRKAFGAGGPLDKAERPRPA